MDRKLIQGLLLTLIMLKHTSSPRTKLGHARLSIAPNTQNLKMPFNKAAKKSKNVIPRAKFDRIEVKFAFFPVWSNSFWFLDKEVKSNFSRPSISPQRKPDVSQTHTVKKKRTFSLHSLRMILVWLLRGNLPLDGCTMAPVHVQQKEVLRTLQNVDVLKANGEGISAIDLLSCVPELSAVLTCLYRLSLESSVGRGSLQTCSLYQ